MRWALAFFVFLAIAGQFASLFARLAAHIQTTDPHMANIVGFSGIAFSVVLGGALSVFAWRAAS